MSWVRAQQNENFRGWYKIQRKDTAPIKTNDSEKISLFDKAGNN